MKLRCAVVTAWAAAKPARKGRPLIRRPPFAVRLSDVVEAVVLLTRLPLRLPRNAGAPRGAATAWAWPLVGLLVGGIGAAAGSLALWAGLIPGLAALAVLAAQVVVTGALHEDGLADTADGLWGGWDKSRRLAIMKDSHIGTYGVLALLVVSLARWLALTVLIAESDWGAVVAAAAISRAPMAAIMAALPNARDGGLSHRVGRPERGTVGAALLVAAVVGLWLLEGALLPAALATALVCGLLARAARAKIGGQTGDVLGASQQLAEVTLLIVATLRHNA